MPMTDINLGVLVVLEDDDNDNDDFPCEEFLPVFPTLVPLLLFDLFFLAMVDFEAQCYCNGEMERIFQRKKKTTHDGSNGLNKSTKHLFCRIVRCARNFFACSRFPRGRFSEWN